MSATKEEQVLDYVESSLDQINSLVEENEGLQNKVAELEEEKVRLEKVASETGDCGFSEEAIENTVHKLTELSYISPVYSEKVASQIKEDPAKILDLLSTISEASLSSSGVEVGQEFSAGDEDPDGWTQLR